MTVTESPVVFVPDTPVPTVADAPVVLLTLSPVVNDSTSFVTEVPVTTVFLVTLVTTVAGVTLVTTVLKVASVTTVFLVTAVGVFVVQAVISSAGIAVPRVGKVPALQSVISSAGIAVPALALPTFVVETPIEPEVFNLGILPSVLK